VEEVMSQKRSYTLMAGLLLLALSGAASARPQFGAQSGEWRTYGGDLGSTRYAPLDQIDRSNFNKLRIAWRFKTDNFGPRPDLELQTTPLMVRGVLYATVGARRHAVAIDAATGELLWTYRLDEGRRAAVAPRQGSGRGVAYWTDGQGDERILFVTIGYQLVALDAKTGRPVPGFGRDGIVDLKLDNDQAIDLVTGEIGLNSAPVVAKDVVVVGAAHRNGSAPRSKANVKGYVRGFDVRTGKRLWIFHTIPNPGEFGNETWEQESWTYSGNTGMWAPFSVDDELGMAYLPIELPTGDYYGGHHPGDNLFSETLVAVDLQTGRRIWHYQLVHHGIWDYDIPAAPILADIVVDGQPIKALAQPSKQGWLYVFDRRNGKPVWPIEERPVEQSKVPGEKTSPTQPFPSKPPAFAIQGVQVDDLIDLTPELKAEAVRIASQYKLGPIYTPPIVRDQDGKLGMVYVPNTANWPGGSYDPDTGMLYIYSNSLTRVIAFTRDPARSDMDWIATGISPLTVQGLPIVKPPWGHITAINLHKGEIVWQVPHGETPAYIRNNPALEGITIPKTGREGVVGTLTTKTLLIAGDGGGFYTTPGATGSVPQEPPATMLHAYDKTTGGVVGQVPIPAPQTGSPITYMLNGKQYIVVAVSGGDVFGEFIAFTLP
jgi:quinoprotein glucose dehydrogenase